MNPSFVSELIAQFLVGGVLLLALRIMQGRYYAYLDQRFKAIEESQKAALLAADVLRRDHSDLRASLPLHYIGREDWITFATRTDAKLDALHRENAESERRVRDEIRRTTHPPTTP